MLAMLELLVRYHHVDNLTGLASETEDEARPAVPAAIPGRIRQPAGMARIASVARRRRRARRPYRLEEVFQPGRLAGGHRRIAQSVR